MRLIVDADSMKPRVREIVARAAERHGIEAVFVANRRLPIGDMPGARMVVADDADEWIVCEANVDDLAITRDVPLAARLVPRGVDVITDRGEHYTSENVRTRLSERQAAMSLRRAGVIAPRGAGYGPKEIQAFANLLDRELTARARRSG
ncbi:MAG: YaiI/YqxD family protein [Spirochaetota bacterium]